MFVECVCPREYLDNHRYCVLLSTDEQNQCACEENIWSCPLIDQYYSWTVFPSLFICLLNSSIATTEYKYFSWNIFVEDIFVEVEVLAIGNVWLLEVAECVDGVFWTIIMLKK